MKKDFLAIIALFLLSIGVSFALYQCKKTPAYSTDGGGGYATQSPPANEVWIQNMSFNPGSITIKTNTVIKWTNKDGTAHTVTSTAGTFDSGNLGSGSTFSYKFSNPGTYTYKCTIHPGMTGTIIVQ